MGSPTDIYMVILGKNGEVLKSDCIAGSDFDDLVLAKVSRGRFTLFVRSQSDDGDFRGSNSGGYAVAWSITVNEDLQLVKMKKRSNEYFYDERVGERDGKSVYTSNSIFKNFDAGTPTALIDYGTYYLIVSENITGIYENTPPYISATWYYRETVYSAYNRWGKLIFRTSVDSSPDYDAKAKELEDSITIVNPEE